MKALLTSILAVALFGACQSPKSGNANEADTTISAVSLPAPAGDNQLSEARKAEGWKLLFNGQNMDGWKTYQGKENDSWEVVDGTLHCKPAEAAKKRIDIHTTEQYGDFDLEFDWKIAPKDNSGVIYRSTEEFDHAYSSGPEYQLIDDKGWPDKLSPAQLTGSNYDMNPAPENRKINAPGEWNTGRILAKGNHVEHWLNGEKILEYELHSPEWQKLKAMSKWKSAGGYGASAQGFIDLQDHGGEVWFRNIRIKAL
jgi:hypothetical protein